MPASVARYIPGWSNTSLNGRALLFSLLLAVAAGIVAGVAPGHRRAAREYARSVEGWLARNNGRSRRRLRSVFAVAQISLAVALVIGAALMSKGMFSMLHLADEYHPENVLVFNVTLPVKRYDTRKSRPTGITRASNAFAHCRVSPMPR